MAVVETAAASVGERVCVAERLLQQDKFARSVSLPRPPARPVAHTHIAAPSRPRVPGARYKGREGLLTRRGGFGGWYAKFDVDEGEQVPIAAAREKGGER